MSTSTGPVLYLAPDEAVKDLYRDIEAGDDSGVDLRWPHDIIFPPDVDLWGYPMIIDLQVRARLHEGGRYKPYKIGARSSIGKTPLSLANSVGIIDLGYTGTLRVAVRNHNSVAFNVKRGESLFQATHPTLEPMTVRVVDRGSAHFAATARGEGGLGSTGASGNS
jgi:dUTPase